MAAPLRLGLCPWQFRSFLRSHADSITPKGDPMKRTSLIATALLALGLVFSTTGCSTFSRSSAMTTRKGPPTYALIVSVSGGQKPTDAQWATMQKNFDSLLA